MAKKSKLSKRPPAKTSPAPRRRAKRNTPPPGNVDASHARAREGKGEPGRPTMRTRELATRIFEWVSNGKPLREFCRLPGSPSHATVYNWCKADAEFKAAYEEAKDIGFDAIAEDALKIADDGSNDTIVDDEGKERCNAEWIARSRLRVETRLKLLSKWSARYADKQQHEHTGKVQLEQMLAGSWKPPDAKKEE